MEIFSGFEFVKIYLDDILVCSPRKERHFVHSRQVRDRLREHNIFINTKKSEICKQTVIFLGQIVSGDGIQVKTEGLGELV